MKNNFEEMYGINENNPELVGEESLNPQNELSEIYPLENINIDPSYFSVFELKRKYDRTKKQNNNTEYSNSDRRNQIILDSDFQREAVWKVNQQSELIESVLMGLPIPVMYFYEDKFANLVVVDGRQRLTAFFEFLDDKYSLTDLKILRNITGKKFSKLDPIYQSKLEDYQLITQIIKPPTPDSVIFHIFDRVNRGGTPLNNQEMRNALYQGNATKLLEKISTSKEFKNATDNGLKSKRMKDKYIILRAIAFYLWTVNQLCDKNNKLIEYKGDVDEFLGKTMEYLNFINEEELLEIEEKFALAMKNAKRILDESAFRLSPGKNGRKSPINMNVFEIIVYIMITLGSNTELDKKLKNLYLDLIVDNDFLENIGSNRDSLSKVEERFERIKGEFVEVIINDR